MNEIHRTSATPTIVVVHGAFADASGWDGVIGELQRDGYPVLAVANPLRGLASDADYLRGILGSMSGPIVLVGHSYGGAVITNASKGNASVKALVYVAAFVPDEGETLGQFANPIYFPGALLGPDDLVVRSDRNGTEVSIKPSRFREIFAADMAVEEALRMAARQRPASLSVFEEPSGDPAWRDIPSWYQVSTQDKAISPVAERFFAQRANSKTVEIDASHAGFISHAPETAQLIRRAARTGR